MFKQCGLTLIRNIAALMVIVSLQTAQAMRTKLESSELFELRSKLESIVNEKYSQKISMRIHKDLFKVNSSVELTVTKELIPSYLLPALEYQKSRALQLNQNSKFYSGAVTDSGSGASAATGFAANVSPFANPYLPSDITMGSISAFNFPTPRENQDVKPVINNTPAPAPAQKFYREQIRISRVDVSVSLFKKVSPKYEKQFIEWLNKSVRAEFGTIGSSSAYFIPPEPVAPIITKWQDTFGNFQNFFGMTVFSAFLAFGIIAWKLIPSLDVRKQNETALQIQKLKNAQNIANKKAKDAEKKKAESTSANLPSLAASKELAVESHKNHQKKIAYLALSSDELIEQAFQLWFDEAGDGRKKLVSVIDCILTELSNEYAETKEGKYLLQSWTLPEKIKKDKIFAQVFRNYGELSIEGKLQICEQAYWDLLSLKTIGNHTMKKRFSWVDQMNPDKINKVLRTQNSQVKSVTIMHLPEEKLNAVVAGMSLKDKKALIEEVFANPTIRENELDVVDQTLEFFAKKESAPENDVVDIKAMIPNVLKALNAYEELQVIKDIAIKRPTAAEDLKFSYPALAFLNQWPKNKLELVFDKMSDRQILVIATVLPEIMPNLVKVIPLRYKTKLKLQMNASNFSEQDIISNLEDVRLTLLMFVKEYQIDLKKMFAPYDSNSGSNAA